ncbi:MAG: type II secretion system protein [Candidatus Omnitrophota bacterium]|nr:type II secretion system GspH family protein [Candidatus Omnitrophota bacterium]
MNKKGFTISELLVVFMIVIITGTLMIPFIQYTRHKLERTLCANNLRRIGLALYIYARENQGRFPETLRVLYEKQYLADVRLLDCPASKSVGTIGNPEYEYFPGLSVESGAKTILVKDKKGNHKKWENVLYVNADIDCLRES